MYMHLQYKCFSACVCLEIHILDFYSSLSASFYERYVYFGNQYRCGKFCNLKPDANFFLFFFFSLSKDTILCLLFCIYSMAMIFKLALLNGMMQY